MCIMAERKRSIYMLIKMGINTFLLRTSVLCKHAIEKIGSSCKAKLKLTSWS
jgi:hypothetical protein